MHKKKLHVIVITDTVDRKTWLERVAKQRMRLPVEHTKCISDFPISKNKSKQNAPCTDKYVG